MANTKKVQAAAMEVLDEMKAAVFPERVLILFSGGADSVFMVHIANQMRYIPICVLFDYGQLHIEELEVAKKYLDVQGINYQIVKVDGLKINSGLTGDGIKNNTGDVHEMHVPMRNSMFLSLACSIAEGNGIKKVWIGCDMDDRYHLFPDCYQEYIVSFNEMLKFASPKEIIVEVPVLGFSKENVLKYLDGVGITPDKYFSGYGDL